MKTKHIVILSAVLLFGGIIWYAKPGKRADSGQAPPQNSAGALSADEKSFDFGTISMAAGNVSHSYKIKNAGAEPVTLGRMYTSCMCTTALLRAGDKVFGPYGMQGHGFIPKMNYEIKSGEEAEIKVVFDPAAHGPAGVGRISRAVIIEQGVSKPVELVFSALVTP